MKKKPQRENGQLMDNCQILILGCQQILKHNLVIGDTTSLRRRAARVLNAAFCIEESQQYGEYISIDKLIIALPIGF